MQSDPYTAIKSRNHERHTVVNKTSECGSDLQCSKLYILNQMCLNIWSFQPAYF